jgi:hypothetical protein
MRKITLLFGLILLLSATASCQTKVASDSSEKNIISSNKRYIDSCYSVYYSQKAVEEQRIECATGDIKVEICLFRGYDSPPIIEHYIIEPYFEIPPRNHLDRDDLREMNYLNR